MTESKEKPGIKISVAAEEHKTENWRKKLWRKRESIFGFFPFILVFLFFIVFRHKLILLAKPVRESFIWSVEGSIAFDLFMLFAVILFSYYIFKDKLTKHFIKSQFGWCLLISVLYTFERSYSNEWIFTPSFLLPFISYLDIVYLLSIILAAKLVCEWQKTKKELKYADTYFNEDLPTSGVKSEDDFGYYDYAKELYTKLSIGNFKKSFAVGICGPWGSGKTSFIQCLKKQFEKLDDNIWVEFSPWNTEGDIQDEFFRIVEQSVYKKNENLARLIHTYSSLINDFVENSFWQKINSKIRSTLNRPSKNDLIESIGSQLIRSNKKLIIVIDDVDRLVQEEILEILRIIRNTGDFKNTIYLVAYDKDYLTSVIRKKISEGKTEYSDKVFQLEIVLPQIEERVIIEKLISQITQKTASLEHVMNDIFSYEGGKYKKEVLRHLKTPRDVIKVANSFNLNFEQIPEDINIKDLLFIEILKLKDTELFHNLYRRQNDILGYFDQHENAIGEFHFKDKDDSIDFVVKFSRVSNLHVQNDLSQLLMMLFEKRDYSLNNNTYKKSICIPSQFATYFSMNLSDDKMSNSEIAQLRSLPYVDMVKKAIEIKENTPKWTDFTQKIYSIDSFDSAEDFKSIIRLKLLYAHNMPNQTNSIIKNIQGVLHRNVFFKDQKGFSDFINEELHSSQYKRNERLKVAMLIAQHDELKKLLSEKNFNSIQSKAIDEQFAEGDGAGVTLEYLIKLLFVEKAKCNYTFPKLDKTTTRAMTTATSNYLKSKLLEWDLKYFLEFCIVNVGHKDDKKYMPSNFMQFYSGLDELLNDQNLEIAGKEKELAEYKKFIKEWGGNTAGIPFDFNHLNPKNMRL